MYSSVFIMPLAVQQMDPDHYVGTFVLVPRACLCNTFRCMCYLFRDFLTFLSKSACGCRHGLLPWAVHLRHVVYGRDGCPSAEGLPVRPLFLASILLALAQT